MGLPDRLVALLVAVATLGAAGCSGRSHSVVHAARPTPAVTRPASSVNDAAAAAPGLVWTPDRLPARLVAAARRLPDSAVVVVSNGTVWLTDRTAPRGMAVPIDVSAASPTAYAADVPAAPPMVGRLVAGQVLLSVGSARLRGVHVGDRFTLAGIRLQVAGVVADAVIGDAEMFVTPADGRRLALPPDRFLLVRPKDGGAWPAIAASLRGSVTSRTPLRLRAPGTARALREGDAVLSPLEEKQRFGEFAADPHASTGGYLRIDPRWQARHLVTSDVPILGAVTCNRAFVPALRDALRQVVRQRLQRLIDRNDYGGCYAPRLIPGQPGQSISHHAFGAAIDLNVHANPQGQPPRQDPRLVAIFARFGLTWGGRWLIPDGMHFEALG